MQVNEDYLKNFFFWMPFDGMVGSKEGKLERNGYGISYGSIEPQVHKISINSEKNQAKFVNALSGTNALKEFNARFIDSFSQVNAWKREGILFSVQENGEFNFSPNTPVLIEASLTGGSKGKGFYYELIDSTQNDTLLNNKQIDTVLSWIKGENEEILRDSLNDLSRLCSEFKMSGARYSLIESDQPSSTITNYKALAFLPITNIYSFNVLCAQKKVSLNIKKFEEKRISYGLIEGDKFSGGSERVMSLNRQMDSRELSIEEMIKRISKGEVCFNSIGSGTIADGLELFWNKEKFSS
jgi:hypothetical protein